MPVQWFLNYYQVKVKMVFWELLEMVILNSYSIFLKVIYNITKKPTGRNNTQLPKIFDLRQWLPQQV